MSVLKSLAAEDIIVSFPCPVFTVFVPPFKLTVSLPELVLMVFVPPVREIVSTPEPTSTVLTPVPGVSVMFAVV